jgi:hypothetical protein
MRALRQLKYPDAVKRLLTYKAGVVCEPVNIPSSYGLLESNKFRGHIRKYLTVAIGECMVLGFHSGNYEEFYLLGYNSV